MKETIQDSMNTRLSIVVYRGKMVKLELNGIIFHIIFGKELIQAIL